MAGINVDWGYTRVLIQASLTEVLSSSWTSSYRGWLHVRFGGAIALGVLCRSRLAAALSSVPGEEHVFTDSGENGGAQVKGRRGQLQGERDPISAGALRGYCGSAIVGPNGDTGNSHASVPFPWAHGGVLRIRCVLERAERPCARRPRPEVSNRVPGNLAGLTSTSSSDGCCIGVPLSPYLGEMFGGRGYVVVRRNPLEESPPAKLATPRNGRVP